MEASNHQSQPTDGEHGLKSSPALSLLGLSQQETGSMRRLPGKKEEIIRKHANPYKWLPTGL